MTVSSTTAKIIVDGNGAATVFSFSPIVIIEATHLKVIHVSSTGVQTTWVLNVNYSMQVTSFPGTGTITTLGPVLTSAESLIFLREVPLTQLTDLENQGGYFPDTQETALDKLTMMVQQIDEVLDRAVRIVPTVQNTVSVELPEPEANKIIAWNSTGTALINSTNTGATGPQGPAGPPGPGTGDMLKANNLSELTNFATARTNLGVYSTAQVDTVVETAIPTGAITMWPTGTAPTNWLLCDGAAVSRTSFAELFALIGTTYGAGDGSTTFNLPNMKGRFPVGVGQGNTAEGGGLGTSRTLAVTGGKESHTLTTAEIPLHGHPFRASYRTQSTARSMTTGGFMTHNITTTTQPAFTGT
ncbi:MAG: tail fiber protein, partial [Nitrospira sp.]|nr:tail fiber protein [Nitrospira sp.]